MSALDIPLCLFAKAPVAGKVKKRLCPPLDFEQAAQVATALLAHAIEQVENGWLGQCTLCATPDLSHPDFDKVLHQSNWQTSTQVNSDLGGRMQVALVAGVEQAGAGAVLGTDIPAINQAILKQAYLALKAGKHVLGPTEDGGFYFLGVQTMPEALFKDIEWGESTVRAQLLDNARALGMDFERLPMLPDCDVYADLQRAIQEVPAFGLRLDSIG
ncbi:MAG: TIGR04282 family arsenosugar biosynthesis glycosyltransferase [Arenicellales bacterium]